LTTSKNLRPLVSVVIPNFNYGEYLREAIASVVAQTYSKWEIIVIDNFSTDNSEDVCREFGLGERLRFIQYKNDGILAKARNVGIKLSGGQIIAFLDSDDTWRPGKLEKSVSTIASGADVTYHGVNVIDGASRKKLFPRKSRRLKAPVVSDLLLRGNALVNSSAVVSKRILEELGGLDESQQLAGAEDYHLWLRISTQTNRFIFTPGLLGSYREHPKSFTKSKNTAVQSYGSALKGFLDNWDNIDSLETGLRHFLSGRLFVISGNFGLARKSLLKAMMAGPWEIRIRASAVFLRNLNKLLM